MTLALAALALSASVGLCKPILPGQYSIDMRSPKPEVKFYFDGIKAELSIVRAEIDSKTLETKDSSYGMFLTCRQGQIPVVYVRAGNLKDKSSFRKVNDNDLFLMVDKGDGTSFKIDVMGLQELRNEQTLGLAWSTSYFHMKRLAMMLYDQKPIRITHSPSAGELSNLYLNISSSWDDNDTRAIASFAQSCELVIPPIQ